MNTTRLSHLKPEYESLWNNCQVKEQWLTKAQQVVNNININTTRYQLVGQSINIPWYFIACIHNMESSLNFDCHLHNGDSLKFKTHRVPQERPLNPPKNGWDKGYTWEESAIDALMIKNFHEAQDWSLPAMLWRLELYNGFGYRLYHPDVLTPYLWSGTNHYSQGKYISDGSWSATATSQQVGTAAILKLLLA